MNEKILNLCKNYGLFSISVFKLKFQTAAILTIYIYNLINIEIVSQGTSYKKEKYHSLDR